MVDKSHYQSIAIMQRLCDTLFINYASLTWKLRCYSVVYFGKFGEPLCLTSKTIVLYMHSQ